MFIDGIFIAYKLARLEEADYASIETSVRYLIFLDVECHSMSGDNGKWQALREIMRPDNTLETTWLTFAFK
jgi:hypothetical protein